MKRIVRAARGVMTKYEKVEPQKVIQQIIDDELSRYYDDEICKTIKDVFLKWKSDNNYDFHHFDKNTSNNVASNVYLIDRDAHSYMHNRDVESLFMRCYGVMNKPGYAGGKHAEAAVSDMWEHIRQDLRGLGSMRLVVNALTKKFNYDRLSSKVNLANVVEDILNNSPEIAAITKSDLQSLLHSKGLDYNEAVDVDYVDDEIGEAVTEFLDTLESKGFTDKMHRKSIDAIRNFVLNNFTSRSMLRDDYDSGLLKHSGE